MMAKRRYVALMMCLGLAVPALVRAQASGAGIAGVVRDSSGAVLPGVTVEAASPALIEKTRTAVTDTSGNYKITDLRPGVYSVTYSLTGFNTVKREGIELSGGFTAPANAELKVGSVEETITVSAATPIVDVQSARTQNVLKTETLDALPSGFKDLTALTSLTLGATTSTLRNDVGGDKGELSTGISIHGSRGDDSRTNYDGMNTNVFYGGGGGQQRIYKFNTVGVAETTIDTSASGAETETGGANVNMVPKDGGNRFSASGLVSFTNEDFASSKVPQSLIDRGNSASTKTLKKVYDYGLGVGGPIKRDKIWFYSANRSWGNQGYGANNYFNKATVWYQYVPDLDRPVYSDQYYKDFGGRVTWQASAKNKISFSENFQTACACWMGIGGTTAPEATTSFVYGTNSYPELLTQASWTYPATNRLLFQAGYSFLRQAVQFTSQGAADVPNQARVSDTGLGYAWGGLAAGVSNDNGDPQGQNNGNYRASMSYVTGSHAWKAGLQGLRGDYNTKGNMPNDLQYVFVNGVPSQIQLASSPFASSSRLRSLGLYVSDMWTLNRLTLSYGVRYDHFNARTLPIDLPAGRFVAARHYDGVNDLPNYSDITPRVAAAYDVFGNGKTAIKGSWGRYLLGMGGGAFNFLAPSNAVTNTASRVWNDANKDFVVDCNIDNFQANGECGFVDTSGFGTARVATTWDDRARKGWNVRDFNRQWSVTVQHELLPNFGLGGGFYHTSWGNTQVSVNQALTPGDFTPYCVTAPTDVRFGEFSGQQVCGLYDQTLAARAKVPQTVWMRTKDVPGIDGERTDVYNGADVSMSWRYGRGGMVTGGLSVGRSVTDDCYANNFPNVTANVVTSVATGVGNRTDGYCRVVSPLWNGAGSQIKFQVIHPLPYKFTISAAFKDVPGISYGATVVYPNSAVVGSLGRNLSACGNVTGACTASTAAISVIPANQLFDDRLNQLDTRLSRSFPISRVRVNANFEIYNVTNTRPSQSNTTAYGATYLRPSSILGGRLLKLGAQIEF